jgi:DNA invertase Pin-like site-specific DNA recombinase
MRRIGYVRTSTKQQLLDLQLAAMSEAGIDNVRTEQASGARDDRPVLAEVLAELEPGDTLTVWRLDRLGRSLPHLLGIVEDLAARGVNFESLHDKIDTSNATGRLIFHIMAALSEFERDLTRERINAGLDAARARGQRLGPPTVMTPSRRRLVEELLARGTPRAEIARAVGISRATLYRHMADVGLPVSHANETRWPDGPAAVDLADLDAEIERLASEGWSTRRIARRVCPHHATVARRLGQT